MKWNLEQFIEEASQREDINQQNERRLQNIQSKKPTKESTKTKQRLDKSQTDPAENHHSVGPPRKLESSKEEEELTRVAIIVGKQDFTLQAGTAQPTVNNA